MSLEGEVAEMNKRKLTVCIERVPTKFVFRLLTPARFATLLPCTVIWKLGALRKGRPTERTGKFLPGKKDTKKDAYIQKGTPHPKYFSTASYVVPSLVVQSKTSVSANTKAYTDPPPQRSIMLSPSHHGRRVDTGCSMLLLLHFEKL